MKAAMVAPRFDVAGRLVRVVPQPGGNVNDTYIAVFRTVFSEERFVLQRVNRRVFASPEDVIRNMKRVTEHVHRRLEAERDDADRIWQLPRVIPSREGADFVRDENGDVWRAISYIASARAFDRVCGPEHAHEAGVVLGQFHRLIHDIPPDTLCDTLPGYHVTPGYIAKLDAELDTREGRRILDTLADARHCRRFIDRRRDWAGVLEDARARGELMVRPIHGDPKIGNIMIDDETGRGTCIIDLDTVKPGLVHYDLGDCLRSCCNRAGEEARDLSGVVFDTILCEAIVRGYMPKARAFLTPSDLHYQFDCVRLMAFELGVRFFADFVAGNVYFKVTDASQNLRRALVQLRLCESIEAQEKAIRDIFRASPDGSDA